MIGGGIYNQPIMGNRVFNLVEAVTKLCFVGIVEASESLVGIVDETVKLTAIVKQRCSNDC